ncbi:MAG: hypothetical protein IKQ69_07855 [Oscillospiraceae bacterium]|nr:hypothetical protein [Oscillospiraceae bacterium]
MLQDDLMLILQDLKGVTGLIAVLGDQFSADSKCGTLPDADNYAAHVSVCKMLEDIMKRIEEISVA